MRERKHMNAIYVEKPLGRPLPLLYMREFTLERNVVNVNNVGKSSVITQSFLNTKEFVWGEIIYM